MGLPEPTLLLTIPSIYDDTTLDCRIYHPNHHIDTDRRVKKGAIVAHPYAPLGGCYDDPVVCLVAKELLTQDFVVCTFNFRGATGSKGRTSWTGRPEREDYISVAGFMMHYLHFIEHLEPEAGSDGSNSPADDPIHIIFGGYSFGSQIMTNIPEPLDILKKFCIEKEGTAASEVKIRSKNLAGQRNEQVRVLGEERASRGHVVVGGEETSPEKRRRSLEVRHSLDIPRKLSQYRRRSQESRRPPTSVPVNTELPTIYPAYLLISPLLPPISFFTALPLGTGALRSDSEENYEKLIKNPSLAVFADDDTFTSGKKLRKWATNLSSKPNSRFGSKEIGGAGHFWHDRDAQEQLKTAVKDWSRSLLERGN